MSILEQAVHVYSKDKQARSTLKIGSPYLFWRQAVHVIGILAVHVYILKNGQSLSILEAGSHAHFGGW
jgi:hypothetical protein